MNVYIYIYMYIYIYIYYSLQIMMTFVVNIFFMLAFLLALKSVPTRVVSYNHKYVLYMIFCGN